MIKVKKNIGFIILVSLLFGCSMNQMSIDEIKADYGDFGNKTIQWKPLKYDKTPIGRRIAHHPENYDYLKKVDIYAMAHLSDDLFITGYIVSPKKAGKYPVIVFNRGGNQDLGRLLAFSAVEIMAPLAAQGYVVVASNYRGNSGAEGQEQFGGNEVNDIKNLLKSIGEFDKADATKVGLFGISRGGMMNYLTLKGDSIPAIKAVVTIGGISDLETTIKHHPQIGEVAQELIPNFKTNREAEIKKRSAVYWTEDLPKNTPILLLHSKKDKHVDFKQVPPFVEELAKNNVQHKLVSFENDTHGLEKHREIVEQITIKWFDDYLKNELAFQEKEPNH